MISWYFKGIDSVEVGSIQGQDNSRWSNLQVLVDNFIRNDLLK